MTISALPRFSSYSVGTKNTKHLSGNSDSDLVTSTPSLNQTQLLVSVNPQRTYDEAFKTIRKNFIHSNYQAITDFCEENLPFITEIQQDPSQIKEFFETSNNKESATRLKILRYFAISKSQLTIDEIQKQNAMDQFFTMVDQHSKTAKDLKTALLLLNLVQESPCLSKK